MWFSMYRRTGFLSWMTMAALIGACTQSQSPPPPATPSMSASVGQQQTPVERGKYLVTVMDCSGCHTPFKNGEPDMTRLLSGHPQDLKITAPPKLPPDGLWAVAINQTNTAWAGPWGVSFTPNLTPDENTGIGSWSEDTFVKAIRTGKHMGVSREILPPMPWRMQANLTDGDLQSIYAYLRRIPAISNHVPEPIEPAK